MSKANLRRDQGGINSSGLGLEFMLTSVQSGSEREKETEGKGAKECSTMRIIRWMC